MTTWLFEPGIEGADPGDALEITLRFDGDLTVCTLAGPLCASTATTLHQWLHQLERNDRHRIIVDAGGVDELSLDGVELLLRHASRCGSAGGALQVRAPSGAVRRALERSDAAHLLET